MSKESFKEFIKKRPELAQAVFNNKTTFQKLYEAYDMYGEDSNVFDELLTPKKEVKESPSTSFKEITNLFRNIDLDTVQKSVNGLQKAVSLISEIVLKIMTNIYQIMKSDQLINIMRTNASRNKIKD